MKLILLISAYFPLSDTECQRFKPKSLRLYHSTSKFLAESNRAHGTPEHRVVGRILGSTATHAVVSVAKGPSAIVCVVSWLSSRPLLLSFLLPFALPFSLEYW